MSHDARENSKENAIARHNCGFNFTGLPLELQIRVLRYTSCSSLMYFIQLIQGTDMELCATTSLITSPIELLKLQKRSFLNVLFIKSSNGWTVEHLDGIVLAHGSLNLVVLTGSVDAQLFFGHFTMEMQRSSWGARCDFLLANECRADLHLKGIKSTAAIKIQVFNTKVLVLEQCEASEVLGIESNSNELSQLTLKNCHPLLGQNIDIQQIYAKEFTLVSHRNHHQVVNNQCFTGIDKLCLRGTLWLKNCSFIGTSMIVTTLGVISDPLSYEATDYIKYAAAPIIEGCNGQLENLRAPNLTSLDVCVLGGDKARLGTLHAPSITTVRIISQSFSSYWRSINCGNFSYLRNGVLNLELVGGTLGPLCWQQRLPNLEILKIECKSFWDFWETLPRNFISCKLPRLNKLVLFDTWPHFHLRKNIVYTVNAPQRKTLVIGSFNVLNALSQNTTWIDTSKYPVLECLEIRLIYPLVEVMATPKVVASLSQHLKHLHLLNASFGIVRSFPNMVSLEIELRPIPLCLYDHHDECDICTKDHDGVIHLEHIEAPKLHRVKVVAGLEQETIMIGKHVPSLRVLELQGIIKLEIDPCTMRQLDELKIDWKRLI